ncbi:hypothetical protein UY3_07844 [Chelonia mydas]|uniref:Uncharacterized protein n=1 Tax=Chelonia mydas TaxID=8469 RepID=M7BHA2_CHEMY|nr:hypothetical protein UY3_07844 [Chelonia mydas]
MINQPVSALPSTPILHQKEKRKRSRRESVSCRLTAVKTPRLKSGNSSTKKLQNRVQRETVELELICKLDTIKLGLNKDWEWMGHYKN